MKRLSARILALCLLIGLLTAGGVIAFADDETATVGTCGDDLTWEFDEDTGTLTISGSGEMDDYSYSGSPWYDLRASITEVELGSGITSIGEYAFYQCTGLTEISIPEGVIVIGAGAFSWCTALTKVSLPDGLIGIDLGAFYRCALSEITLPEGLRYIGEDAFGYCQNMDEITIPASVVYIGDVSDSAGGGNFYSCNTIYGYTNSGAYWYADRFAGSYGNYEFSSIGELSEGDDGYIAGSAVTCGTKGDNLCWILYDDGQLFVCGIGDMEDTKVGNTSSAEWLWDYRGQIQKVTITDGVTSIGNYAFASGSSAGHSDVQFDYLTEVVIGDDVTSIGSYAFNSCPVLETVSIGVGVTSIGNFAFSCDTALQNITVSEENTYFTAVDNILFSKDGTVIYRYPHDGSTEYEIPDGVTSIGIDAFGNVETLTSITIPVSLTTVSWYAFDGCSALTDVYYAGSESEWDAISIGSENDELTGAVIHYAVLGSSVSDADDGDADDSGDGSGGYADDDDAEGGGSEDGDDADDGDGAEDSTDGGDAGDGGSNVDSAAAVTRLAGSTRYSTMAAIVEEAYAGQICDYAVLATGANFADALSAASLAGALDAPIVLVKPGDPSAAIEVLQELGCTYAYVVGGTSAVSASDVEAIEEACGVRTQRLAGSNRRGTAREVAEAANGLASERSDTCIVATGKEFADALSASPYSYWAAAPIYLTRNDGTLDSATLAAIEEAGYDTVVVMGGTSAVTAKSEAALESLGVEVERLSGSNRYGTCVEMAQWSVAQGMSYDGAAVATGAAFPDALAGATLCGRAGSVMLLATDSRTAAIDLLAENAEGVGEVYLLGGESAVSANLAALVEAALG